MSQPLRCLAFLFLVESGLIFIVGVLGICNCDLIAAACPLKLALVCLIFNSLKAARWGPVCSNVKLSATSLFLGSSPVFITPWWLQFKGIKGQKSKEGVGGNERKFPSGISGEACP